MSERRRLGLLIVEDELLLAMLLEDMVERLGHRVIATANSLSRAEAALDATSGSAAGVDAAIVDYSLGTETAAPLLERLARDSVPFVLATGYEAHDFDDVPAATAVLRKPYQEEAIRSVLVLLDRECVRAGSR